MQYFLYQYINDIFPFYDDKTVFNISSTGIPFIYNIAKSTPKVYLGDTIYTVWTKLSPWWYFFDV